MNKRRGLRRSLLLDSSRKRQTSRKTRTRNRLLSLFSKLSFVKNISKFFKFSILTGIALTGMMLFLVFAIFSSYYKLKTISVVRNYETIPAEVIQNISSSFLGENMFFLRHEDIKLVLKDKFPEINDINITEKWPSEIEIGIELSPARYNIFDEGSANFSSITNSGIIISNTSTEGLPLVKILQHNKSLSLHTRLISEEWLRKIDLAEDLIKNEIKLPVKEMKILMKARELHIITSGDGAIWIDLSQDIEQQIKKLILAEGKIKLYSERFVHIDLRIPKQIFWQWQ